MQKMSSGTGWLIALFLMASVSLAAVEVTIVTLVIPFLTTISGNTSTNATLLGGLLPLDALDRRRLIVVIGIIFAFLIILRGVLQYFVTMLSFRIPAKVMSRVSENVFSHMLAEPLSRTQAMELGYKTNLCASFPERASNVLKFALSVAVNLTIIGFYGALIFSVSYQAAIISIGCVLLIIITSSLLTKSMSISAGRQVNTATASLSRTVYESLSAISSIKMTSTEKGFLSIFSVAVGRFIRARLFEIRAQAVSSSFASTSSGLVVAAIIIAIPFMGDDLEAAAAGAIVVIVSLLRLVTPLSSLNNARVQISSNTPALTEIVNYLSFKGEEQFDTLPAPNKIDRVKFHNVSYTYQGKGGHGVHNVCVTFSPGEIVGLVGASGSGKSTIVNLLGGLHRPQVGEILINGTDLRMIDQRAWRRRIQYIGQMPILLNATIEENIRFFREDISQSAVESAVRASGLLPLLKNLDDGLNTPVGENGSLLSGGQRQRVALARGLAGSGQVVILDEATANLDTLSENAVIESIKRSSKDKIVIIITHRMETVLELDRVLVMDSGRCIGDGHPLDLIRNCEVFRRMTAPSGSEQGNGNV